jgi:hypothetical protein
MAGMRGTASDVSFAHRVGLLPWLLFMHPLAASKSAVILTCDVSVGVGGSMRGARLGSAILFLTLLSRFARHAVVTSFRPDSAPPFLPAVLLAPKFKN